MEIGPEHGAIHVMDDLEHVMVVVPVDAEKDEAERIHEEARSHVALEEGRESRSVWPVQFEHHDGDKNRDHPVAERLESSFAHRSASRRSTVTAWASPRIWASGWRTTIVRLRRSFPGTPRCSTWQPRRRRSACDGPARRVSSTSASDPAPWRA